MSQIMFKLAKIIKKPTPFNKLLNHTRFQEYHSSKFLIDLGEVNTKFETTRNPEDWKYVENILPQLLVPEPIKKDKYPSGWKPQGANLNDYPYFIARTKNHMMPVYLEFFEKQIRKHTVIKKIQGDIWALEKNIRPFLEDVIKPRHLRLQVNEFAGTIRINGDVVNAIKHWLGERNF